MGTKNADYGVQEIEHSWGISVQTNRKIFFCLNLLFLLPALIKNGSPVGLVAAGVLLSVLFAVSILFNRGIEPASAQITILLFFDGLIQIALRYEALIEGFRPDYFEWLLLTYTHRPPCVILTGIGVVLGLVGLHRKFFWLTSFSGVALGTAIILLFWSSGGLGNFRFLSDGEKILAVFLLCAFIWTLFSRIVLYVAPKKWGLNIFLSIMLLCGIVVLHLLKPFYVRSLAADLPDALLTWGQVNLVCVVLLGCALAMANDGTDQANFDSLTLLACAVFIFAAKFLSCSHFMWNWLLFLLLITSMLQCLKNAATDDTTLGLCSWTYMFLQTGVFFFSTKALQMGLYANVILAAVTGLVLWSQRTKRKPENFQDFFCGILITFFVAEALAWQWRMRFSREGVILMAVVFLMAMGVLLLVSLPHPDGFRAPNSVRVCVCACVGILCLLSMVPTLWIQAEVRESKSYIEVRGLNGATAAEVSYCWKDWRGQAIEETELKGQTAVLPIRGNILTITAVDEKGIRSSRDFWYPVQPNLF